MTVDVEDSLLVEHTFSCLFVVVFFLRFSHSDFDRGASAARALYSYQMVGLLRKKNPSGDGRPAKDLNNLIVLSVSPSAFSV